MRRTIGFTVWAVGLGWLVGACSQGQPTAETARAAAGPAMAAPRSAPAQPPLPPAADAARPGAPAAKAAGNGTSAVPAAIPRKVIYEGWLTVETGTTSDVLAKAQAAVKRRGGYVTNVQQSSGASSSGVGESGEATLRVPAAEFDATMGELAALGTLRQRRIEAKDVGEEWVDTEARVATKKREEQRLLDLLEKVSQLDHVLELERELSRVRGEIEQAEGRLRYLGNQVELSTIHLSLNRPIEPSHTGWRLSSAYRHAALAFVLVGQAVISLVLYLAALAPYLLLLWAVIWLAQRAARRLRPDSAGDPPRPR